jgi:hypothetical protein
MVATFDELRMGFWEAITWGGATGVRIKKGDTPIFEGKFGEIDEEEKLRFFDFSLLPYLATPDDYIVELLADDAVVAILSHDGVE